MARKVRFIKLSSAGSKPGRRVIRLALPRWWTSRFTRNNLCSRAKALSSKSSCERVRDGTTRDVTHETSFLTNHEVTTTVDGKGMMTAGTRGEAFVMARYDQITVGTQVLVIPEMPDFKFPNEPEVNYIDTLVHNKLKKIRITPSGVCDDNTFVRRAYLDIIGVLPTPEAVKAFVADKCRISDPSWWMNSSPGRNLFGCGS